jgi:hypothetical protein
MTANRPTSRRSFQGLLLALCLMALVSCGYHVAGRGDRLPPDVRSIAIPIFTNSTHQYHIEQKVSAAITREFIARTKYQVTVDPAGADAVLKGDIKDVRAGVVAYDLATGRATTMQVQVLAQIDLVNQHTKKVLFSNHSYTFREEYQISQNPSTLFEEQDPALDRLSRDLARTLVTAILENF